MATVLPLLELVLTPSQFIHQALQRWRQRSLGADALLQPFANGVADRAAGLVIDFFVIAIDSGIHGTSFGKFLIRADAKTLLGQVARPDIVSARTAGC
jgi:hypothetical protein